MKTGSNIVVLPSVDSTNIYAMQEVHADMAKHGTIYFAMEQTAGKGQRGRKWHSTPGENIMISAIFSLQGCSTDKQFLFSIAVALGCYDFYKSLAGDEVSVKWPNDIYWRDRKAGGILIENLIQGQDWKWAIAGIGLNINQTVFDHSISRDPVSLKQITGKTFDPIILTRQLSDHLEQRWQQFLLAPGSLLDNYNQVLFKKGETIALKKGSRKFMGRIQGVDDRGQLIAITSMEERFSHGEVEWL